MKCLNRKNIGQWCGLSRHVNYAVLHNNWSSPSGVFGCWGPAYHLFIRCITSCYLSLGKMTMIKFARENIERDLGVRITSMIAYFLVFGED